MRKALFVALMVLLTLPFVAVAASKKQTPTSLAGVKVISAKEVKNWLDEGKDMIVIDARKSTEYGTGHIPDSENCAVPSDLVMTDDVVSSAVTALNECEILSELNKEDIIITYCNGST